MFSKATGLRGTMLPRHTRIVARKHHLGSSWLRANVRLSLYK